MSAREKCISILDTFDEFQLVNVATMLQSMKQAIDDAINYDVPNETTIAALIEGDEMIRTGSGQHFKGSAEDFFAMLDAECGENYDA